MIPMLFFCIQLVENLPGLSSEKQALFAILRLQVSKSYTRYFVLRKGQNHASETHP